MSGETPQSLQGVGKEVSRAVSAGTFTDLATAVGRLADQGEDQQVVPTPVTDQIRQAENFIRRAQDELATAASVYHRDHETDRAHVEQPRTSRDAERRAGVRAALSDS